MKKNSIIYSLIFIVVLTSASLLTGCGKKSDSYNIEIKNKNERQFINKGNNLYNDGNYEEAMIEYRKALQENPNSTAANYNLALSLIRQAREKREKSSNTMNDSTVMMLVADADSIFTATLSMTNDSTLISMIYHNLGNIRYETEDYQNAVKKFKLSLIANPNDDDTRYNLRMAQLKLAQQQQQNKDKNNDQNQQDKDKQNQDQQNQDQQNQDKQNQDKDKDQQNNSQNQQDKDKQNQDKDQQDAGNKDQNKEKEQQGNKDQNKSSQNSGDKKGQPYKMDDRNIEQVLKAAQDKENETRNKVLMMKRGRRENRNKW